MGGMKTKAGKEFPANKRMEEDWSCYSRIWRNILSKVLNWSPDRVDTGIEELRRVAAERANSAFGFPYDLPSRYLFRSILGEGLHERIMNCKSNEANPHLIYQRLTKAITANALEWEMEQENFDWQAARDRYRAERQAIEQWLTSIGG